MQGLFALSAGWFLATWWLLAVVAVVVSAVGVRWLRFPSGGPTEPQGDPATGHDLAELDRTLTELHDGELRAPGLDLPPSVEPVALVPLDLDTGLVVLMSTGHILLADPSLEQLRVVAATGRPWRAAAAYMAPTPHD